MAESVKKIIADERSALDEGAQGDVPKIVQGLVGKTDHFFFHERDALDVVVGAGWNSTVRSFIKKPGVDGRAAQLDFWPEEQRELVAAVGVSAIFVPSRSQFVALIPGMLTPSEVYEAAVFMRDKGEESIRRSQSLFRLSEVMARANGADD